MKNVHPQKSTNPAIALEHQGWLEDEISTWDGLFLGAMLVLADVFGKVNSYFRPSQTMQLNGICHFPTLAKRFEP